MPVEPGAFVTFRHVRQTMRRLKYEFLEYRHTHEIIQEGSLQK
jgi:hypothetical protein